MHDTNTHRATLVDIARNTVLPTISELGLSDEQATYFRMGIAEMITAQILGEIEEDKSWDEAYDETMIALRADDNDNPHPRLKALDIVRVLIDTPTDQPVRRGDIGTVRGYHPDNPGIVIVSFAGEVAGRSVRWDLALKNTDVEPIPAT